MLPIAGSDPCPCGSGREFEECCLPFVRQWPVYDERHVLSSLLRRSARFSAYYTACRPKIRSTLFWTVSIDPWAGTDYLMRRLDDKRAVIPLRRIPSSLDDEFPIAHELQHVLICEEGFPATEPAESFPQELSTALNNALHHPLVFRGLKTFGFDVEADLRDEVRTSRAELTDSSGQCVPAPESQMERALWVIKLLDLMLKRQETCPTGDPDGFEVWFAKNYPSIARKTWQLLAALHETGYDTPVKSREAFAMLIRELHLENAVRLV